MKRPLFHSTSVSILLALAAVALSPAAADEPPSAPQPRVAGRDIKFPGCAPGETCYKPDEEPLRSWISAFGRGGVSGVKEIYQSLHPACLAGLEGIRKTYQDALAKDPGVKARAKACSNDLGCAGRAFGAETLVQGAWKRCTDAKVLSNLIAANTSQYRIQPDPAELDRAAAQLPSFFSTAAPAPSAPEAPLVGPGGTSVFGTEDGQTTGLPGFRPENAHRCPDLRKDHEEGLRCSTQRAQNRLGLGALQPLAEAAAFDQYVLALRVKAMENVIAAHISITGEAPRCANPTAACGNLGPIGQVTANLGIQPETAKAKERAKRFGDPAEVRKVIESARAVRAARRAVSELRTEMNNEQGAMKGNLGPRRAMYENLIQIKEREIRRQVQLNPVLLYGANLDERIGAADLPQVERLAKIDPSDDAQVAALAANPAQVTGGDALISGTTCAQAREICSTPWTRLVSNPRLSQQALDDLAREGTSEPTIADMKRYAGCAQGFYENTYKPEADRWESVGEFGIAAGGTLICGAAGVLTTPAGGAACGAIYFGGKSLVQDIPAARQDLDRAIQCAIASHGENCSLDEVADARIKFNDVLQSAVVDGAMNLADIQLLQGAAKWLQSGKASRLPARLRGQLTKSVDQLFAAAKGGRKIPSGDVKKVAEEFAALERASSVPPGSLRAEGRLTGPPTAPEHGRLAAHGNFDSSHERASLVPEEVPSRETILPEPPRNPVGVANASARESSSPASGRKSLTSDDPHQRVTSVDDSHQRVTSVDPHQRVTSVDDSHQRVTSVDDPHQRVTSVDDPHQRVTSVDDPHQRLTSVDPHQRPTAVNPSSGDASSPMGTSAPATPITESQLMDVYRRPTLVSDAHGPNSGSVKPPSRIPSEQPRLQPVQVDYADVNPHIHTQGTMVVERNGATHVGGSDRPSCCRPIRSDEPLDYDYSKLSPEEARKKRRHLTEKPDPSTYTLGKHPHAPSKVDSYLYDQPKVQALPRPIDPKSIEISPYTERVLEEAMIKEGYAAKRYVTTEAGKGSNQVAYFVHPPLPPSLKAASPRAKRAWAEAHAIDTLKIRLPRDHAVEIAIRDEAMMRNAAENAHRGTIMDPRTRMRRPVMEVALPKYQGKYERQRPVKGLSAHAISDAVYAIVNPASNTMRGTKDWDPKALAVLAEAGFVNRRGNVTTATIREAQTFVTALKQDLLTTHPDVIRFEVNNGLMVMGGRAPDGSFVEIGRDSFGSSNIKWDKKKRIWVAIDL